jgi:membrane protease YdiL (CAAX protease family)
MSTINTFIKRHPVLTYYALTFAISWGCVLMIIGPGGILGTKEISELLLPFTYMATLLGPSVAGIILTGLVYGKAGFRELLSRLLRWRVGARWYAVALLTAPLLITAVLLALSLISPVFLPGIFVSDDKASLLLSGIVAGLMVGIFEELGWTGFAVPRLRTRYSVLTTGLILGFLWGLWHFPLFSGSGSSFGTLPRALYLSVQLFSWLPPFRVLMVWVYDRTESLLVAMLMHVSLTASTLILQPLATVVQFVTFDLVWAAALWVFVAAVIVANRGQLLRQSL